MPTDRLAQSGKLEDVRADWEDWQLDLMLQQVKQKTAAALRDQGKADRGNYFGGSICSTRLRRGRGEVHEADESQDEAAPSRRVSQAARTPSNSHRLSSSTHHVLACAGLLQVDRTTALCMCLSFRVPCVQLVSCAHCEKPADDHPVMMLLFTSSQTLHCFSSTGALQARSQHTARLPCGRQQDARHYT